MKKLVMLLAVLIATPVFALSIDMNDIGDSNVAIQYSDANAANLPRAFALEFSADKGATITLLSGSFKSDGESSQYTSKGFGIYPARIVIDGNGNPTSYGNPLADPCDLGSGSGDGSSNVVLEFGSLYSPVGVGSPNAPAASGTLCTLRIDCGTATDVNLTMVDEDTYRGGVLLEDGTPVNVEETIQLCAAEDCFPSGHPDYDEWVAVGKPDCWCGSGRQCHGDADDGYQFDKTGAEWYVGSNDLAIMVPAWQVLEPPNGPGLTGNQICADFDHDYQFDKTGAEWRVGSNDLAVLVATWQVLEPPNGVGIPPDCLDVP